MPDPQQQPQMTMEQMKFQMEFQFRMNAMQLAVNLHAAQPVDDNVVLASARAIETYLKGSQLKLV